MVRVKRTEIIQNFKFSTTTVTELYQDACNLWVCTQTLVRHFINHIDAELNLICHLLALLEAHHILYVSRIRVK